VYDPISYVVYVGTKTVSDMWVRGRRLLRDGVVVGVDRRALHAEARQWGDRIRDGSEHLRANVRSSSSASSATASASASASASVASLSN